MASDALQTLPPRERVLAIVAALLDGIEAESYLGTDLQGSSLGRIAGEIACLPIEIRIPLLGTILRRCIRELRASKNKRGVA